MTNVNIYEVIEPVIRSPLIPLPGNDRMVDRLANAVGTDVGRIVTTNTVPHAANAIDVTTLLLQGVRAVAG
jgi:hypothetical protein